MAEPALKDTNLVLKYKSQVLHAGDAYAGLAPYTAGDEIAGDALRSLSQEQAITGPQVCQLCKGASFLYGADSAAHKARVHFGENEYRKRVRLRLLADSEASPNAADAEEDGPHRW